MELMRKTIEEKNKIIHELSIQSSSSASSSGMNSMVVAVHSPGSQAMSLTSSDLTSSTETITSEVSNLTTELFQSRNHFEIILPHSYGPRTYSCRYSNCKTGHNFEWKKGNNQDHKLILAGYLHHHQHQFFIQRIQTVLMISWILVILVFQILKLEVSIRRNIRTGIPALTPKKIFLT